MLYSFLVNNLLTRPPFKQITNNQQSRNIQHFLSVFSHSLIIIHQHSFLASQAEAAGKEEGKEVGSRANVRDQTEKRFNNSLNQFQSEGCFDFVLHSLGHPGHFVHNFLAQGLSGV